MSTTPKIIEDKYPLPAFRFIVALGKDQVPFTSVSGLDLDFPPIEYKDGTGGVFHMPGPQSTISITLRKGMLPKDTTLYEWINGISLNQVEKRDISISLVNASASKTYITYTVSDAFPTKLTGPSLDASGNSIAFEEISLTASKLSLKMAS